MTTQHDPAYGKLLVVMSLAPHEIGRRLKEARERKGLTQLAFALEASVSPSSVARWEAGRLPPLRELYRLCRILDCEISDLLEEDTPKVQEGEFHALRRDIEAIHAMLADLLARETFTSDRSSRHSR